MGGIDQLLAELERARADLIAAFTGMHPDRFEARLVERPPDDRWSVRDIVWHVGLVEDWTRRAVDQGVRGGTPPAYVARARPAIAQTPDYLAAWLEQCRRPLLALLRRLPEDGLDISIVLPDGQSSTAREMLERVVVHDREHAAQIQMLKQRPADTEEGGHGDEKAS